MNKWFYRAVGTVGVASGFLMLAGGVAQADEAETAQPALDPQRLRGLLDTYLTPTAGALSPVPVGALAGASPLGAASPNADRILSDLDEIFGIDEVDSPAGTTTDELPLPGNAPAAAEVLPFVAQPSGRPERPGATSQSLPPLLTRLLNGQLTGVSQPFAGISPGTGGGALTGGGPVATGGLLPLPMLGPVGVDTARDAARLPAIIGDSMAAQRASQFEFGDSVDVVQSMLAVNDPRRDTTLPAVNGLPAGSTPPAATVLAASARSASGVPVPAPRGATLPRPPAARDATPTATNHGSARHAAQRPGRHAAKPGRHAAPGNRVAATARHRTTADLTARRPMADPNPHLR